MGHFDTREPTKDFVGKVQVYTGEGKGKTTAALGLAMRAVGQGFKVCIIQFMKGAVSGEHETIRRFLPTVVLYQYGKEAMTNGKPRIVRYEGHGEVKGFEKWYYFPPDKEEQEPSRLGVEFAKKALVSGEFQLVILDEINTVVSKSLVSVQDVLDLIASKPNNVELVLTGRGAPKEITDAADLVTEAFPIKHYFKQGVIARRGIEY